MLDALKTSLKSLTSSKCNFCGQIIDNDPLNAMVKVPGYTGKHKRSFCNKDHLDEWRAFISEWEENNHEIPNTNKGSTCVNCMR